MPNFVAAGEPLTPIGVETFVSNTSSGIAEMWAVLAVETSGCGFLPSKRPKILFERHVFHALTKGIYDQSHPDISQPSPGGYGLGGENQYNRLAEAVSLDRENALKSASWGIGQIMGFNFQIAGYASVEAMIADMATSEDQQLAAMSVFLTSSNLDASLSSHDWTSFALGYNGPNYAQNNYDGLLRKFYYVFTTGPQPDLRVRAVQILLTYQNFNPGTVDGILGQNTSSAISQFQQQNGLPVNGQIDDNLIRILSN